MSLPRPAPPGLVALVAVALLALGACTSPPTGVGDARVLRLAHGLSTDHPVHVAMLALAAHADSASDGRLQVAVYPSGQLGSERESLELLQIGSLAMTKVSASVLEAFAPEFAVFSLPYLFRDDAHRFAVLDGPVGRDLLASTAPYRLRGLAYYDAGARSFYTAGRPVRQPSDLAGQKIRVQESPTALAMVRAMGGSPTPVSWGELYTALQQGVVDGAENNPPSFYLSRHYEVATSFVLNEHTAVPDVLVIGTPAWDGLTDRETAWLREAADYSARVERVLWAEATAEALAAVEAAGVEVVRLTAAERAPFEAAVAPLLAAARRDAALGPVLRRIEGEGGAGEDAPARPARPAR